MTKTNLVSKLLFPLIILGGSIFVGNESAFAFNIYVPNYPSSSTTRLASNGIATIEDTTYTNVPVPNFPGETMTCVITFDSTQFDDNSRYTGECFSNSLNEVASQYNPVDSFSVNGEIVYDPEQPIPGAPAPDPVPITYDFTVTITQDFTDASGPGPGPLFGKSFSGFFTFNSLGFTGVGEESFSVSDLSFRFQGTNYTEQEGILDSFSSGPEVSFSSGEIEGLDFFADVLTLSGHSFQFQGGEIAGNIAYTLRQDSSPSPEPGENSVSVPEPSTIFGLFILSAMGYSSKLKKLKVKSQK